MENFLRSCRWILVRLIGAFVIAFGIGMTISGGLGWSLLGAVISLVGIRIIEVNALAYQNQQRYGFSWRCDRCLHTRHQLYSVRAVDEKTRDEFRDTHNRTVHLEER